jgi:hypothetical protein
MFNSHMTSREHLAKLRCTRSTNGQTVSNLDAVAES